MIVGRRAKAQNELNTGEHELVAKRGATYGVFFSLFRWKEKRKREGTNAKEGMWWNAMVAGDATVAGFADGRLRVVRHEVVGV